MSENPYQSPRESETDVHSVASLAYHERIRAIELQRSRRRWQLWQAGAWLMAGGVIGGFVHVIFFDLEFGSNTMVVDVLSICLFGGGLLLCLLAPVLANQA